MLHSLNSRHHVFTPWIGGFAVLLFLGVSGSNIVIPTPTVANTLSTCVASYQTTMDISPGSEAIIRFSIKDQCFYSMTNMSALDGLSDIVKKAIVKSPIWIQQDLARQFLSLNNPEPYAWLLINASKQWTDELAFSLASSPLGNVADVKVLYENVAWLYKIDQDIQYANIVDYDSLDGQYYSTIQYACIENGTVITKEYPKEIYYWFVVQPELLGEHAQVVYDSFWRSFLYAHNDLGYPLLREKINAIQYLWDHESYTQPGNRLWDEWIFIHPTALEAVSYWIGKTVPFQAIGDHPNQPNIIAHEHNGWCGELQRLAIAAMRSILIPTVGVCNIAEDHVWREFYDGSWHQNDNWWADSGGTVNTPDIYWHGWGKSMSSIFAEKGDGSIYDVTSSYIDPENRVTVSFDVVDDYNRPYDGIRVTVFVKGLKDITWYKNTFWTRIDALWNRLPDFFKEHLFAQVYHRIEQCYEKIPDIIDGYTISIWNYTDVNGRCTFVLGNEDQYVFLIQGATATNSWPIAKWNTIRMLNSSKDTRFHIKFPDMTRKLLHCQQGESNTGVLQMNVSYTSSFYQVQENIRNHGLGIYHSEGAPSIFLLNRENLEKFKLGKSFQYLAYNNDMPVLHLSPSEDVYIVCYNPTHESSARVILSVNVTGDTGTDTISFVSPSTTLFEHPSFNVGDLISISGVSNVDFQLLVNGKTINMSLGLWSYCWNTSGLLPGEYVVQAVGETVSNTITLFLFDATLPVISLSAPKNGSIVQIGDTVHGKCTDASGIQLVEVAIDDDEWIPTVSTPLWSFIIPNLSPGIHSVSVRAKDTTGLIGTFRFNIVINGSNPDLLPSISSIHHTPIVIENTTNVIVLANISCTVFPLKQSYVSLETSSFHAVVPIFPYATSPILERHPEDPLINKYNGPCYGCELGVFPSGETVTYHLLVIDVAGHRVQSEPISFFVR